MKKALILIPALAIASCAGYRQPESFAEKMARFTPRNTNPNQVPSYSKEPPFKSFSPKRTSRGPASTEKGKKEEMPSTKRLYFMALYGQYLNLGQYLNHSEPAKLNHCPAFHTTFVNYKEKLGHYPKLSIDFSKRVDHLKGLNEESTQKFPELSLPMADNGPTFYETLKTHGIQNYPNFFENAVAFHLAKTYKELSEICDSGTSENYYNYENLTRHIKREGKKFTRSTEAFKAYMKTTLFSNTALLESLGKTVKRGRVPASASEPVYTKHLMKQLDAPWSPRYFQKIGRP